MQGALAGDLGGLDFGNFDHNSARCPKRPQCIFIFRESGKDALHRRRSRGKRDGFHDGSQSNTPRPCEDEQNASQKICRSQGRAPPDPDHPPPTPIPRLYNPERRGDSIVYLQRGSKHNVSFSCRNARRRMQRPGCALPNWWARFIFQLNRALNLPPRLLSH